jgi:hypothetical protein
MDPKHELSDASLSNSIDSPHEASVASMQPPFDADKGFKHGDSSAAEPQRDGRGTSVSFWTKAKGLWQSLLDYLQDSWFLEIAACVFAVALLSTEIGVLAAFNGQVIDTWPWQWSLNSAVALLTALLESSLLFAIVSCLGQMKWLWFRSTQEGEKRLIWIDFLARSNTPFGALSLLLFHATTWK